MPSSLRILELYDMGLVIDSQRVALNTILLFLRKAILKDRCAHSLLCRLPISSPLLVVWLIANNAHQPATDNNGRCLGESHAELYDLWQCET